jgi:putative peptidoglycan lipid II flippase
MEKGSVSWLTFADRLMEFPNALLGVALGTILLPSLSKASQEQDHAEYSNLLDWGLRLTFLLAMPAAVGIAVLALPLIATMFHHGEFSDKAAIMSAQPLLAYAVGLVGIILVKSLTPAFYARQDVRTPVRIGLLVLVFTQLMNLVFIQLLKMNVAGLALSISVAALLNASLLYRGLRQKGIYSPLPGWSGFFTRLMVAIVAMGVAAWFGGRQFDWLGMHHHGVLRAGALLLLIGGCMVVYFGTLFALGFRVRDFKRRAK